MEKEEVKTEQIDDAVKKHNESVQNNKKKSKKLRAILVISFILIYAIISYVQLRGSYLEYLELGEKYLNVFYTNLTYKYSIMAINFVILYFIIFFTNKGIRKGLKPFFEKEKKVMPKLPNKTFALVISVIVSLAMTSVLSQKIMLLSSNTSFGIQDSIFNLDISYFVFQKPILEIMFYYFIGIVVGITIYMALYYIVVFNKYFDGVDGRMLKQSLFMKKLYRNIILVVLGIAILTILNIQNIVFGKILSVSDNIELIGAGITESTVKLWGYIIFAIVIVVFSYRALKNVKKGETSKVLKNLAVIPAYLVALFIVMVLFDIAFVKSNELDKQKEYILENINSTKNAYNINIEETNIDYTGTITEQEVSKNNDIVDNVAIITQDVVLKSLEDNQTETGYYSYRNANIANYNISGKQQLVYVSPREIKNLGRTYNNKTYEYTHGMGEIITSATQATETGNVQYVQKDISGKDELIQIKEPRIYFGLGTTETIATNTKNKSEYDYTDESGVDYTSKYDGTAGLKLDFLDRLILGITKGDLNLAFSGELTEDSKILINRNIMERAKKSLPYLIYDDNPYTVVTEEGKLVWVLDAYTISNCYPYSQYTPITHNGVKENINYIRNSVKVIIDAYDGSMSYYITDRTDPIAMAYKNMYSTLFEELDKEIPEDISQHFVYPQYLYNIQSEILKTYHNVKTDVLYRGDDIWDITKYNSVKSTKSTGTYMNSYYTMVNLENNNQIGLVQLYTPDEKQNIISCLIGTTNGIANKLTLYKYSADSNIVGPIQLDKQIEEDEAISTEISTLSTTGTKITKQMIVVPIENTLLYVEPIYQTMLNESDVPLLKKVIVASGNKVAIGDNLKKALENLLSKYAVDIEVENTDDIQGVIDAIIKANNNLTQSNKNNDWELMGKDIEKLQTLINTLDKLEQQLKKKNQDNQNSVATSENIIDETNLVNTTNTNVNTIQN